MLTIREFQVLSCRERDLTNKQAAAELGISIHTVKHHVAKILRKLKVHSCAGAIGKLKALPPATPPKSDLAASG